MIIKISEIINEKEMEEYEEICDKCKGRGFVRGPNPNPITEKCKKCKGTGKITWIDKIKEGINEKK